MKNKKLLISIIIIAILIIILLTLILISKNRKIRATDLEKTNEITVVPTMNDEITADSSWCGTFQLVWNDMKNEVVKQDVIFTPQLKIVDNLNKEDFDESMLSEEYYYKIYGLKTLNLKRKIENGIKEKFNQTSEILNDFDWTDNGLDNPNDTSYKRYFFYTMLYRKFEFLQEFDKLKNDKFGNEYENVKYFGIDKNTKNSIGNQMKVLYYYSKDDFAVLINTKTNDEVIFCKNPIGKTFNEIYLNMNEKTNKYNGSKSFKSIDEFKAPCLTFNEKKEYKELENKRFPINDPVYNEGEIYKAIQTIKLSLDEKGGEIKSEAAIDMMMTSGMSSKPEEPRYFYIDDTFTLFLREKGKSKPYFAGRIDDITKFQ